MKRRLSMSNKLKERVMEKNNWKCYVCGNKESALEIHHITPVENGGRDNISNLVSLCHSCHMAIHKDDISSCIENAIEVAHRQLKTRTSRISNIFYVES